MRTRHHTSLFMSAAAGALALSFAGVALAQDVANDTVESEEIVVTAQKREQRLQDVPVAVTAFTASTLENQSTQGLTDLSAKAPNLLLAPVSAAPYAGAFFIRGLGFADVESSFEPSVGVEFNGVYLARNSGALMDFFDIASVEVLRGPQGTLYGRNTIGGLISMRTKKPGSEMGGAFLGTLGDRGRREVRAAIDIPVSEEFAIRTVGLYKDYNGYFYNETLGQKQGGQETISGRVTAVWTPSDTFDAMLIVDATRDRGTGNPFKNASLPGTVFRAFSPVDGSAADGGPFTVYQNSPLIADIDTWGATLEMNWDVGFGVVTSVTGYREFDDILTADYDASRLTLYHGRREQTHHQFSEELRIASSGEGPLNYVFGAYFLDQAYEIDNIQSGTIVRGTQSAAQSNTAYAVFGQIDYNATEALVLTVGGRYSYEEKSFWNDPIGPVPLMNFKKTWNDFSPKLGVSYKFNDDIMGYAQWQQGFRSGGFNGRANTLTAIGPFDAENVDAYEIGLKTTLADGKIRLNVAVFRNEYSDMQTGIQGPITDAAGNVIGFESITANASGAQIDGVEVEFNWVVGGGFTINAAGGYLDAGLKEYFADLTSDGVSNPTDNSDLPMAFAPKWSGALGLTWERDYDFGTVIFNANAVYQDDIYTSGGTINRTSDVQMRKANTLLDATLKLETEEGLTVGVWGKNLTDEVVINSTFGLGALGNLRVYSPPRTWGVELGYKF